MPKITDPSSGIVGGIQTVGNVVGDLTLAPIGTLARSMRGQPLVGGLSDLF